RTVSRSGPMRRRAPSYDSLPSFDPPGRLRGERNSLAQNYPTKRLRQKPVNQAVSLLFAALVPVHSEYGSTTLYSALREPAARCDLRTDRLDFAGGTGLA